jgi:hypothetical protein
MAWLAASAGALALACQHPAPLRSADSASEAPFSDALPIRLTYNLGQDQFPSWLPGGSGIVYTTERTDRSDEDWCLAEMPATGGSVRRYSCTNSLSRADSLDTFRWPAVAPDGRVALYWTVGRAGFPNATRQGTTSRSLAMGVLGERSEPQVLRSVPYSLPGGAFHLAVSQIRWLDSTTLVYRGDFAQLVCYVSAPGCQAVWVESGQHLVLMRLGDAPVLEVLPGTEEASSVAVGTSSDEIYFTVNGDTRVFRRALYSGATTVVHDFGGPIARDVQVAGDRLVAIVGGSVTYQFAASAERFVQEDDGGDIHVVNLASGAEVVVSAGALQFRFPAISPDGRRLVAQSWDGSQADLYLFAVP